ncbi:hypothetical protein [Mesorhizobium sp. RMAD-H1]|uniref:hypothetical protein n=1 Tax=Mesorhizobium sp. RMAD-H1 TaxID=2587065 RepID=UPI001614CC5E|nr:hypothetical protein [Mesorhizobium sp. RMAD-H1]MBB2973714.1 hypothetical protein [Mesorhizobium sp. RMAD-H1]
MDMHFIVMAASAEPQGWRFYAGMDEGKHPIWGEPASAIHFPTFQQACRMGGAQICASITHQQEAIQ